MATKTAVQSKTIWVNVLTAVSVVIAALVAEPSFNEMVGGGAIVFLNVVNIILRRYTDKPIEGVVKPKKKPTSIVEKHEEILNQSDDNYIREF